MAVQLLGYTGMDFIHRRAGFGKLRTDFLRLFVLPFLRDTVDSKVFGVHAILFAEHIADAHCLKAHILAAVRVAVDRKLCVAEFLRYALTESNAVANIFLDKKRLLLIIIKSSHS